MIKRFDYIAAERSGFLLNPYTILYLALLLLAGWRVTSGLEQHMDILFWDEANYLNRGLWMFDRIPRVWGPSYSAWYKLLSYFEPDKIALYYLNFRLMTIGTAVVAFFFLSVCGIRQWIAFLLSALLLLSSYNLPVWPKISHYCIIIIMLAGIAARYTPDLLAKWCIFSLALLITAYARPELFLSFSMCFMVTLGIGIFRFKKSRRPVQILFAGTLLWAVFICWFYKTPFNSGDSGRSIKVFYQHFSMNYIQWNHLDLNWWLDWPEIIRNNFKHPESISAILQYDGALFWQHIISNIKNYFTGMGSLIAQLFIPYSLKNNWLLLFGFSGLLLYFIPFRFHGSFSRLRAQFRENQMTLAFLLIFILPGILVCIYAYPRAHYLVINLPLLLLLSGILLCALQQPKDKWKKIWVLLPGLGLLFFAPGPEDFELYQLERKEKSLANLQTLQFLQKMQPADTLRLFDLEGDLSSMLSGKYRGYTNAYFDQHPASATAFIDQNHIDVIYVTPTLKNHGALIRDTAFQRLLNKPELHQFYPEKTGNFTPYLLIRKKQ
jgi:hypothetical protein